MIDRYYKDEPMTRVNKGLFAVASLVVAAVVPRSSKMRAAASRIARTVSRERS